MKALRLVGEGPDEARVDAQSGSQQGPDITNVENTRSSVLANIEMQLFYQQEKEAILEAHRNPQPVRSFGPEVGFGD